VTAEVIASDPRIHLARMAWRQFHLDPLLGTGSGTFLYHGRQFRPPHYYEDPGNVHNDYLQLLAEYGILGTVVVGVFLLAHGINGWRATGRLSERMKRADTPFDDSLALTFGALASVSAYLVHSAVDFNLHIPANALTMAFVFGILTRGRSSKAPVTAADRTLPGLLPVLGLWTCFVTWPRLLPEYFAERTIFARYIQDHAAAIAFAEKGLRYDPANPRLLYRLAQAQMDMADPLDGEPPSPEERQKLREAAVENYRRGVAAFPQDVFLWSGLTRALDELGRFEEAEAAFSKIFPLDPNNPLTAASYALHLERWGKLDAAEAEYHRSLNQHFNWPAKGGIDRIRETRARASPAR
jgi:tetratricopeptide (TPR) repeat protein